MKTFRQLLEQLVHQGEHMSQQLDDLQNAVAALEAEDDILIAAVVVAVTELQSLESQIASLGTNANTDTAALAGISSRVSAVTAKLASAVTQLAAADPAPVSTAPVVTPAPTPAPVIDQAPTAPPAQ
jgi:chromosome segregation ATPase